MSATHRTALEKQVRLLGARVASQQRVIHEQRTWGRVIVVVLALRLLWVVLLG